MGKSIAVLNESAHPTVTVKRAFLTQIKTQLQEAIKIATDADLMRRDLMRLDVKAKVQDRSAVMRTKTKSDYEDFKIRLQLSIEQLGCFRLPSEDQI